MFVLCGKSVGVKLEEYNGKYSLVSAYQKDGEVGIKWCKIEDFKDGEKVEVNRPVKIYLGDAEKARGVLNKLLDGLPQGQQERPEDHGPAESDLPF